MFLSGSVSSRLSFSICCSLILYLSSSFFKNATLLVARDLVLQQLDVGDVVRRDVRVVGLDVHVLLDVAVRELRDDRVLLVLGLPDLLRARLLHLRAHLLHLEVVLLLHLDLGGGLGLAGVVLAVVVVNCALDRHVDIRGVHGRVLTPRERREG